MYEGNRMLIFEKSQPSRRATTLITTTATSCEIPETFLRQQPAGLPEVSELQVVRHYTGLSQRNIGIDTSFYPLGSCTMKYNPRIAHKIAMLPGFASRHPLAPLAASQGIMQCLYELQQTLAETTGMDEVAITPMAGAQGEWVGVMMMKQYHHDNHDFERTEMLVPDAAHGTNPASAVMAGFTVKTIPTTKQGDVDIAALAEALSEKTAGIMLTNPSTLGVFERDIEKIAKMVHEAGGLLYYDGANLNAILGKTRPGDMGFDVIHMNLHKTFATPHGGGGPGAGPVAANKRLAKYLPAPMVGYDGEQYYWLTKTERPESIGRVTSFMGNAGILLRAHVYARLLGAEGFRRVAEFATLNANYLMQRLQEVGYPLAFPDRKATHEFIVTLKSITQATGITALEVSKRLIDFNYHPPTMYFPQLVAECLLIEPTETESKETLDRFITVMQQILNETTENPELIKNAPQQAVVKRVDEVLANKKLQAVAKVE